MVGEKGIIATFIRHPIGANLLIAVLLIGGLYGLAKLNIQFFPTFQINYVIVTVVWPGAGPEDVATNILDVINPQVRFIDKVKDLDSYATQGEGTIILQFEEGANIQKAVGDVERIVDNITNLPEASEKPKVFQPAFYEDVTNIAIYGPFSELSLRHYARQIRDALIDAGIDKVDVNGYRNEEIIIDVAPAWLQRYKLTIEDIAAKVRSSTGDLPAGQLESQVTERRITVISAKTTLKDVSNIEITAKPDGSRILLSQIAKIGHRFTPEYTGTYVDGSQALELTVRRATSSNLLKVQRLARNAIEQLRPTLPKTLKVNVYQESANLVKDRISMLSQNVLYGFFLVIAILLIFLDWRVAIWVAIGIPVAMMATFGVMEVTGQSINMISLFGLIMMLGVVVDDAIVIGEHTSSLHYQGFSPLSAAQQGVGRMFLPVMASSLTTAAAFLPILMVHDIIGKILQSMAIVSIIILAMSTIECFLVLPGHLRHSLRENHKRPGLFRRKFDGYFAAFRDGPFRTALAYMIAWRYLAFAGCLGVLIIAAGLIGGRYIGFNFFPSADASNISASLLMAVGTPQQEVRKAAEKIKHALDQTEKELSPDMPLVKFVALRLGSYGADQDDSTLTWNGSNLATVTVELVASEYRQATNSQIMAAWRKNIPAINGVETIAINARRAGPPGKDIEISLAGVGVSIANLKKSSVELQKRLASYANIRGISDNLPYGKKELSLTLTPKGQAIGFTPQLVARQLSSLFDGVTAKKVPFEDTEIELKVRADFNNDQAASLKGINIQTPDKNYVPLLDVVTIDYRQSFSMIRNRNGKVSILVTATVDKGGLTPGAMVAKLKQEVIPNIEHQYGVKATFGGREKETSEAFSDLELGSYIALGLIYLIIAWVFSSYFLPLAVMAIIPFGVLGTVVGHMVMGFNLSILSMFGLLGLSGILVNDSIILVNRISELRQMGYDIKDVTIQAACDRLRAVILTTLTTMAGLIPLLFETNLQAQFLKPMAITIVFGLGVATFFVLFLVPILVNIGDDFKLLVTRITSTPSLSDGGSKKSRGKELQV